MQVRPGTPASTRRGFLKKGLTAGAITLGANAIHAPYAFAGQDDEVKPGGLSKGDAALLRFAAAAEILETDFWVQYTLPRPNLESGQNPLPSAPRQKCHTAAQD